LLCVLAVLNGCGGRSAEGQPAANADDLLARRDVARLKADLEAANKRHEEEERKYADAEQEIEDLKATLGSQGLALKTDPIGQLHGQGFTDQQIADLLFKSAPPPPPSVSPGWRRVSVGAVSGESTCTASVSVAFEAQGAYAAARPDTPIRTAFVKIEYSGKRECPKESNSAATYNTSFDCVAGTSELLTALVSNWKGERSTVDFQSSGTGRRTTVFPGTFVHEAWTYVCGQQ
jgi:hypothetical protein